jgi:hypothetical protein
VNDDDMGIRIGAIALNDRILAIEIASEPGVIELVVEQRRQGQVGDLITAVRLPVAEAALFNDLLQVAWSHILTGEPDLRAWKKKYEAVDLNELPRIIEQLRRTGSVEGPWKVLREPKPEEE